MTLTEKLLSIPKPLETLLLSPNSPLSIYALGFALTLAFAFLAFRQKRRRGNVRLRAVVRVIFARRVLFHRSTFADLGYFVFGVMSRDARKFSSMIKGIGFSALGTIFATAAALADGLPKSATPMDASTVRKMYSGNSAIWTNSDLLFDTDGSIKGVFGKPKATDAGNLERVRQRDMRLYVSNERA